MTCRRGAAQLLRGSSAPAHDFAKTQHEHSADLRVTRVVQNQRRGVHSRCAATVSREARRRACAQPTSTSLRERRSASNALVYCDGAATPPPSRSRVAGPAHAAPQPLLRFGTSSRRGTGTGAPRRRVRRVRRCGGRVGAVRFRQLQLLPSVAAHARARAALASSVWSAPSSPSPMRSRAHVQKRVEHAIGPSPRRRR